MIFLHGGYFEVWKTKRQTKRFFITIFPHWLHLSVVIQINLFLVYHLGKTNQIMLYRSHHLCEVYDVKFEDEVMNSKTLHFPKQNEGDELVRDLCLFMLLTSRLKEWNLLDPTCKVCTSRKRPSQFFSVSEHICYCANMLWFSKG